jgi:hypothetical protein
MRKIKNNSRNEINITNITSGIFILRVTIIYFNQQEATVQTNKLWLATLSGNHSLNGEKNWGKTNVKRALATTTIAAPPPYVQGTRDDP